MQNVFASIKERIKKGEFLPGSKIPTERQLIAEFGVSRTVVREAVAKLKSEKLIDARRGAGMFVLEAPVKKKALENLLERPSTLVRIIEAHELRTVIETGAARLAAQRASPAHIADMYFKFNAFKRKVDAGEPSAEENLDFHLSIAEAAFNERYVDAVKMIAQRVPPGAVFDFGGDVFQSSENLEKCLEEHREIMDAITARDSGRAARAMSVHLSLSLERQIAWFRETQARKAPGDEHPFFKEA